MHSSCGNDCISASGFVCFVMSGYVFRKSLGDFLNILMESIHLLNRRVSVFFFFFFPFRKREYFIAGISTEMKIKAATTALAQLLL